VPPVDVEAAIMRDRLFEQVMLIGEGRPYLSAIAVLDGDEWTKLATSLELDPEVEESLRDDRVLREVLERIGVQMREVPGFAEGRRVALTRTPWSVENGLLTPTLKLKRARVLDRFQAELDGMYAGH
jgi:long-chain acyl-CoA synthetase